MDDILSVLTRDDSFQARRGGGQVSFIYCLLLTDVTHFSTWGSGNFTTDGGFLSSKVLI